MAPRQKRKSRKQRNRQRFQSIFEDSHPVENNQLWSPKIHSRQSSPLIEKMRQPTAKVIVRDLKSDTPRKYVVSSSSEDDEDTDTDTDSDI